MSVIDPGDSLPYFHLPSCIPTTQHLLVAPPTKADLSTHPSYLQLYPNYSCKHYPKKVISWLLSAHLFRHANYLCAPKPLVFDIPSSIPHRNRLLYNRAVLLSHPQLKRGISQYSAQ